MSVVEELLRTESDGSISFGNHHLDKKSKLEDYEFQGDIYKVKTFRDLLYYASPVLVTVDIILRVVALAGHFG